MLVNKNPLSLQRKRRQGNLVVARKESPYLMIPIPASTDSITAAAITEPI